MSATLRRLQGDSSEDDLVARARTGDGAAFEALMRRYNQRVFRAARSVLRDDAEAEDVVQETFVRAYRHLADFQGRSSLGTWLMRIAVHEALARVRRSRLVDRDEEGISGVPSTQPDPEAQASSRELRSLLIAAIDSLPEGLRTVFVLRDVEGLSTLEASDVLQLSPEAVRVRLHRARLALRRRVEKELGAEVEALFTFAGARCDAMVRRVFRTLGLGPGR
jgi:RNA polymerase sigma-70 factor (ECF subfamily)